MKEGGRDLRAENKVFVDSRAKNKATQKGSSNSGEKNRQYVTFDSGLIRKIVH